MALILAGTPPIPLLVLERKRMHEGRNDADKSKTRGNAREHTMLKWQKI